MRHWKIIILLAAVVGVTILGLNIGQMAKAGNITAVSLEEVQVHLSEAIATAQLAQQELKEWRTNNGVDEPLPVDISNLKDFESYSEMKGWFEDANQALPPGLTNNGKFIKIRAMALRDGYYFNMVTTTTREYYDFTLGVYITKLNGGVVAGGKYYIIKYSDNGQPAYLTVGNIGGVL